MKRFIISLFLIFATWQAAFAMSYERAREEALYLTDKMAYELNLNDQQYNDAYEINLDYFLALDSETDLYADYLSYRLSDLRHILYDWQYNLMLAADYFIRPVYWRAGGWHFPIYTHYTIGYFYYSYPTVYYSYRGGHGRIHYRHGFYAERRPIWHGGLRGHQPVGGKPNREGRGSVIHGRNGRGHGDGYHFDLSRRGNDRSDRGNSFSNSSSRNPRNDYPQKGSEANTSPRSNHESMRSRTGGEMSRREGYNSSRTNGNYSSPRNSNVNRSYGGSRGSSMSRGGFNGPRGGSNGGNVSRGRR